jgi:hypothetical protein
MASNADECGGVEGRDIGGRRNIMNSDNHLNSFQTDLDGFAGIAAPHRKADELGKRFVMPWRLNADTAKQSDDAGCGQAPAD